MCRRTRLRTKPDRRQVGVDRRVPLVGAKVDERGVAERRARAAREVAAHVDTTELRDRCRDGAFDRIGIREVDADRHRLATFRAHGVHDCIERRLGSRHTTGLTTDRP